MMPNDGIMSRDMMPYSNKLRNMCTNPIRIYNKAKYHNCNKTRLYMYVPCGKCAECIAQKRAEWSLRSSIEYDWCIKNGGYVFFDSLTYNPSNLPRFKGIPCFRKEDIQGFLKRLRKRIADLLGIKQRAFRYFYVSEYGHDHKRPHYHILFFVSKLIPPELLKKLIKEEWIYGFTDLNSVKKPSLGVVQSYMCCQYVAKYVTKPDPYVSELVQDLKLNKDIDIEDVKRHFYPFHQQSTGFGESLLFDPKQLPHFKEMFCVFNREKFTLPMYYVRRLYYKLETYPDGSQSWVENSIGLQFIPQYKYKLYEDYTEQLRAYVEAFPQFLSIPKVCASVSKFLAEYPDLYAKGCCSEFPDSGSILRYCTRFDADFVSRFAFWKRFEQGYLVFDEFAKPIVKLQNCDIYEKVYLNLYSRDVDRVELCVKLDSQYNREYLLFDSLLMCFKASMGNLEYNTLLKKDNIKKLFTFYNYGN